MTRTVISLRMSELWQFILIKQYVRKMNRDKKARRDYFDVEKNKRVKGDIYITNILDEEMRWYDARLR